MVGAVFVDELGQLSQWECLWAKLFLKAHRENGWTNREKHSCYSAFWCQDEFPPKTENNEFTGNCPGITWCNTSEEPLTGHHQPSRQWWKHIPEKLRKAVRLKGLAGAVGKEVLYLPNLVSEEDFPVLNQTWRITKCYNWANCISVPSLSITENLVLYFLCFIFFSFFLSPFFFFFVKSKTYNKCCQNYKHSSDLPSASHNRIPAHHSQSQVRGGRSVKRLGRKMFLCLCQLCLAAITGQAASSIRIAFCVKHLIIRKWGLNVIL